MIEIKNFRDLAKGDILLKEANFKITANRKIEKEKFRMKASKTSVNNILPFGREFKKFLTPVKSYFRGSQSCQRRKNNGEGGGKNLGQIKNEYKKFVKKLKKKRNKAMMIKPLFLNKGVSKFTTFEPDW